MSLQSLFSRALQLASQASGLATMDDETQNLAASALRDLNTLSQTIDASGMFSANESLEDLATGHLPFLLVEYVAAETEGKLRTLDRGERVRMLYNSQRHLQSFLIRVAQYDIIPEEDHKLYSQSSSSIKDAAKRRELKIKQFKAEKELRGRLDMIRNRRGQPVANIDFTDDLGLVASMIHLSSSPSDETNNDDDDEDLRDTYLLIIRLTWAQAQSRLESMAQELELLHNAPPRDPEPVDSRTDEHTMWRLDPPVYQGGPEGGGQLLDSSGRPLRPFIILPGSASSQRERLKAEVFRPDHRLPTMTVDEYVEEEKRRGNIISGGGPQSQSAPTRSEQLMLESEMDGTVDSEVKGETKRQEDERWARYTDLHPKGEGNTMNRG